MRKGFADQSLTITTAAGDVRKTLAQTQDAATRLGELKEEVQALRTSIPAMFSRLTPADGRSPVDPGAVLRPATPGAAVTTTPPPSTARPLAGSRIQHGMSDYAGRQLHGGHQGFEEFLKAFPTSPRAASAQTHRRAEFIQSRFEQAIAAFTPVIQNYPKDEQVPWAYYKRGLAQSRLGQTAAARASFEAAVMKFPDTEPGVLPPSRLQGSTARRARRRPSQTVTCSCHIIHRGHTLRP